jgi:hypothetical protein
MPDIEELPDFPPRGLPSQEDAGWAAAGNSGADVGATVTAAASTNTKGSWTQLIASTTKKVVGLVVSISAGGSTVCSYMLDIGTGASGSEAVLIPNLFTRYGSAYGWKSHSIFIPVQIPAATRIAARVQSSSASAYVNVGVSLMETEG